MSVDRKTIATLYRTELRIALRDKRTVFFSLVLPLALMPVILFSSLWTQKRRTAQLAAMTHSYVLTGPKAGLARAWIATALARPESRAGQPAAPARRFVESETGDPGAAVARGDLSFYVTADQDAGPGSKAQPRSNVEPAAPGAVRLTFVYRGDRDASRDAAFEMRRQLADARHGLRAQLLESHGFPVSLSDVASTADENVASARQVAGLNLGRVLTLFLLFFVFTGGAVVATDSLAGEKERGTLETLLTTAAGRNEIIVAKSLLVLSAALVITVIQTLNFLAYVALKIVPVGGDLAAAITPATVALLFVLYLPLVALISSALLATSGWARSYKEAQLYFMPVMLLGLLPALAPMLPAVRLRSAIVVVPMANVAVAAKEILSGSRDWPFIVVAWLVTALAAAGLARVTVRMLRTERLISTAEVSREELLGGPALFPRRVLRAFALMWVATTVVSNNIGANLRGQLLFNVGVVFIGGSLLLIRLYRLDLRSALALRPVKPVIWLGLLAGIPGGLLTSVGLFRLVSLVLPVPNEWIETFSRQLAAQEIPLWQLLPLTTLLPGVGEEIAFRGVLLHGLSKRLRPVALCCAVGVVFGIFHFDMARLIPVSCLGALLAGVTLLTGSIFPAMVWHALNNGLSMIANQRGFPLADLPALMHVAGLGLLAVAAWIFWRNRTPYPDLRPRPPGSRPS